MEPLYEAEVQTDYGVKRIQVFHADATKFDEKLDVLTISCFKEKYLPIPKTLIQALLDNLDINVSELAMHPMIDLRDFGNVWISNETSANESIGRIGAIEMSAYEINADEWKNDKDGVLSIVHTYFQLLEMAAGRGVDMKTVGMPVLGAGQQSIDVDFIAIPLINECIDFLKRCKGVEKICIIELSAHKAYKMARALEESYRLKPVRASNQKIDNLQAIGATAEEHEKKEIFLSYSSQDFNYMKHLSELLEARGLSVWYAPRDIWGEDYASSIVNALKCADYTIVLVSENSLASRHVLNEIDLAFNSLASEKHLLPILLDETEMPPAYLYYLSRLQWYKVNGMIEQELQQFVDKVEKTVRG